MLPLHLWSSGLLSLAFEMKWFLIWIFTLFLALARVFLSLPPCFVSTSHLDLLMFKAFRYYLNLNIIFCFLTLSWVACPPLRFHSIDILKVSKLGQAIVKFWCETKILADLSSQLFASNFCIYRVDQKKGRSQNIIVFHELLSLGCINFKNLCTYLEEEVLRFPKHPQLVKFGWFWAKLW